MVKRILSGIQPSGKPHIGNYLGAMKQHLDSQEESETERFFFIANYHALTTSPDRDELRERSFDVARSYLALGLDPSKTTMFLQSDVPEHTELAWILTCVAPMGLLERCTSYKDKIARGLPTNHGLFAYPVLQSADILIYDANVVPVGKDQKQHVEVCRDLAIKINNIYGEVLTVPDAYIKEDVAVVPGTDGQKMSKSYQNTIDLFAPKKQMKKQVMAIVTDSKELEDPKDPDTCNVFALYKYFSTAEEQAEMAENYRRGGYGYGHAKLALLDKIQTFAAPHYERYQQLVANPDEVLEILREGGRKARVEARKVMDRVRDAVGLL